MSLTYEEADAILKTITYKPGWKFMWAKAADGDSVSVGVQYVAPNSTPGSSRYQSEATVMASFSVPLASMSDPVQFTQAVFAGFALSEMHEAREFFRVGGVAPFHPHRIDGQLQWVDSQAEVQRQMTTTR